MDTTRADPAIELIPLGGLGEFGTNTLELRCRETSILIDAGASFPGPERFGVDLMVADLAHFRASGRRLAAVVLTHGHEDHIGGVPYVWDLLDGPVYGTPLTLALLEHRLREHGVRELNRLVPVTPGDRVDVGPLGVEFIEVAHSLPGSTAVAVHTPLGPVIHTGDYKFDDTPVDGCRTDRDRLEALGREGVLALLGDSTNVSRPGRAGSERAVRDPLAAIIADAPARVVVTTFASSLHRIQLLVDLAVELDRRVAVLGRGLVRNVEIAERLGHLSIPTGVLLDERTLDRVPPREVLCLATGSQGEPLAALSRIATDQHRAMRLDDGDVVVFSARAIPGNQRAIGRVMDHVARRGARVVDEGDAPVHVSGHGHAADLEMMLRLVRPRYFVPIHGEYRYLARHARVAHEVSDGATTAVVMENGERLCFDGTEAWRGAPVPAGRVLIDGTRHGEIADEVLRERRHLSADGVVVLVAGLDPEARAPWSAPAVVTRGVVAEATETLRRELPAFLDELVDGRDGATSFDRTAIEARLQDELPRFVRRHTGRRPLVVPVVVDA